MSRRAPMRVGESEYLAIREGRQSALLVEDDGFEADDVIGLHEWDSAMEGATGREVDVLVTHVLRDGRRAVLSIKRRCWSLDGGAE